MEETRIDRWLWAVRLCKTRAAATQACRAGHIRINGTSAKAARPVRVGDRVEAHLDGRQRILEVVEVIDRRVGATTASSCLLDHSPPPPPAASTAPIFTRDPSTGRPTKRERRLLDRLRQR